MSEIVYKMKNRRGSAAEWLMADPVLSDGEFGIESDTGKIKIGNGVTAWSVLPYLTDHDHPEIGGGVSSHSTFEAGGPWRREYGNYPVYPLPNGRYLAGAVEMEDEIFLIAGKRNAALFKDVWKSSDRGSTWSLVNDNVDFGLRHSFGCVALNGDIIVIGGDDGAACRNDVWKSSDGGASWSLVGSDFGWGSRSGFGCVVHDGLIFLIGGYDGITRRNDVWKSSDGGASWSLVNNDLPGFIEREHFKAVSFKGALYVIGGHDGGVPGTAYGDVWKSSDGGYTWSEEASPLPFGGRSHYALIQTDERMLLISGFAGSWAGGDIPADVWEARIINGDLEFSPVLLTSEHHGSTAPEAAHGPPFDGRWGAAAWYVNDTIIMAGGCSWTYETAEVWISEPTIKSANAISIGQIPVDLNDLQDGSVLVFDAVKGRFMCLPMDVGGGEPPIG